jgi:chromatin remodeling complex protein RSC6
MRLKDRQSMIKPQMPSKKKVTPVEKVATPVVPVPAPVEVPVPVPAPVEVPVPPVAEPVAPVQPLDPEAGGDEVDDTSTRKKRREVTNESVAEGFAHLQQFIEDEIERLRLSPAKVKGIKFLRSVNKQVKLMAKDTSRVARQKSKVKRAYNPNRAKSGFMKPVKCSDELCDFAKWDQEKEYSRVDCTRMLCAYIQENKLQQESDRRNIIPDEKLATLLRYDETKEKKPLTYFALQQRIQHCFPPSKAKLAKLAATE